MSQETENLITTDMVDDWAVAAMQGLVTSQGQKQDLDIRATRISIL